MMTEKQIMQKHPKGTNPAHVKRMKFHMDHGVNFSTAHNMAESEGFIEHYQEHLDHSEGTHVFP